MKKTILSLLVLLLSAATMSARDDSSKVSRTFTVSKEFTAINVSGNIEVEYTPAGNVNISARAIPQVLDALKIYVKNGTLYLETEAISNALNNKNGEIKVKLSAPVMSSYITHGNSELEINGAINLNKTLTFNTSGNSSIEANGTVSTAGTIKLCSSGNSKLEIERSVKCEDLNVEASGNSDIDVEGTSCSAITATTSGNSSVEIEKIQSKGLTASASGNSVLKLSGNATTATLSSTGNSEIKARKLVARNMSTSNSGNSSITK